MSTKAHFSCLFSQRRKPGHAGRRPLQDSFAACAGSSMKNSTGATRNGPLGLQDGPYGKSIRHVLQRAAYLSVFSCIFAAMGRLRIFIKNPWLPDELTSAKFLQKELSKRKNRAFCIYLRNKFVSLRCYPQTEATQWARWVGRHIYG